MFPVIHFRVFREKFAIQYKIQQQNDYNNNGNRCESAFIEHNERTTVRAYTILGTLQLHEEVEIERERKKDPRVSGHKRLTLSVEKTKMSSIAKRTNGKMTNKINDKQNMK